jgi:hypothetical protein
LRAENGEAEQNRRAGGPHRKQQRDDSAVPAYVEEPMGTSASWTNPGEQ